MQELKLHADGKDDHLDALHKKYISLKKRIKGNSTSNESEKNVELKILKKLFEKEKRNADKNLY